MKVLWFSNSPAMSIEYLGKDNKIMGTGGWLYSLNKLMQNELQLSVVFHYPYQIDCFKYQQTTYFPIYTGNIILENLKKRIWGKVYDQDFLPKYLDVIEEIKPDIIHIHGTENPYLCIIGKTSVPIIVSIQGNLTVYYHKFLSGFYGRFLFRKSGNINFKSLILGREKFNDDLINMRKMSAIEQKTFKNIMHILGRTDWDRRITRVFAYGSNYYSGNEILRDPFYESKWENKIFKSKIVLFTTNSNNYYKGFETLCHALHLLNLAGIDACWRVAGIFKNSLINSITKSFLGKDYPKQGLILLGSLDENELIKNMKETNIYVMPSHIENSPNNLCEAMILGLPCISTFSGGTGSMLKDGEEGILIQDGDPWAMAGAIIELINDPEKAIKYGNAARERALLRHDKDTIVKDLLETYKTIIVKT